MVGNPKTGIKMYDSKISGCSRTTLASVASSQWITSLKGGYSSILIELSSRTHSMGVRRGIGTNVKSRSRNEPRGLTLSLRIGEKLCDKREKSDIAD